MPNRGFDMLTWSYVLAQKETFIIFVCINIFPFGVNQFYYANMKDHFIRLLLGSYKSNAEQQSLLGLAKQIQFSLTQL